MEQDPIPLYRDLQHMLSSSTRAINTCSAKKQSNTNHVTSVSATELKKMQMHKEINNYRNKGVDLVRKAGPFLLTRFPRRKD